MPWPTREQRQAKQEPPAAPVAVIDEPSILNEEQSRSLFKRQIEARLAKAQKVLAKREAEQQRIEAGRLAEEAEAVEAAAELARIEAEERAEVERAETARLSTIAEEYEQSGALHRLSKQAVQAYVAKANYVDPVELARLAFTQRFNVEAPPAPLWTNISDLEFECPWLYGGTVMVHVDIRPGLDAPAITLWSTATNGDTLPGGNAAIHVDEAATLGRLLCEYTDAAALFYLSPDEAAPVQPVRDYFEIQSNVPEVSDAAFLAQFGLLLDAPAGI